MKNFYLKLKLNLKTENGTLFKNNFKSSEFYLKIPNFYSGEKEAGPQKIYIF